MPLGKFASFSVHYLDSKKLPEYTIREKVYSEVNLHGPRSYFIEEDEQKYPVVPFYLDIVRNYPHVVWIKIFLDGQVLCSRPLTKKTFRNDGVKVGTEIRELLFSLPRIMENQEKKNPLGEYAGTIRMVVLRAMCQGQKVSPVFQVDPAVFSASQERKLQHLTKMDIPPSRDTVGRIVSREGRPTLNVTSTGRFRTLKRFVPTTDVLEELVLYYRPHVSSHVPTSTCDVGIKQEVAVAEEAGGLQPRAPLSDVGNTVAQQWQSGQASEKKLLEEGPAQLQTEVSGETVNVVLQCDEGNAAGPGDEDMMETEEVNGGRSEDVPAAAVARKTEPRSILIPMVKVIKQRDSCASAMIPPEEIKRRESCAFMMIPPERIKKRESCGSAMIPLGNIKQRESCGSAMIPLGNIKQRESCGSAMIPLGNIKQRESCGSAMIPLGNIKQRESCGSALIPPGEIKQQPDAASSIKVEQKESQWLMERFVVMDESNATTSTTNATTNANTPLTKVEQDESKWPMDGFVVIDSDSDEGNEICMYDVDVDEESILYMGTEYDLEGDSLLCLGDDDCCLLDVSNHVSLLEIDDTLLDL